jgi:hypothetical protein
MIGDGDDHQRSCGWGSSEAHIQGDFWKEHHEAFWDEMEGPVFEEGESEIPFDQHRREDASFIDPNFIALLNQPDSSPQAGLALNHTQKRRSSSKRKTSVSKDAKPKKKSSLSKKRTSKPSSGKEFTGLKNTLEGLSKRMKGTGNSLLKVDSITAIDTDFQGGVEPKVPGSDSPAKIFLVDFRRNSGLQDVTPAHANGSSSHYFSNSNHLKKMYSRDKNKNSANTLTTGTTATVDSQNNQAESTPSSIHHILNCQSLNKEINESIDSHRKKARRDLQSGPIRAGRPFELTKNNLFPALLDDAPAANQSSLDNSGRERAEGFSPANCMEQRGSSSQVSESDAKKSPSSKQTKRSKRSVEKTLTGLQGVHFKTINEVFKLGSIKTTANK